MRTSLATAAVLGGLLLAGVALPAQAGEPLRLSAAELDSVTAGASAFLAFAGSATATGSLLSSSAIGGVVTGQGDDRSISTSGYVIALGIGASGNPGGSSSDAATAGVADGTYTKLLTVSGRGGGGFASFSWSATGGAAVTPIL